MYFFYSFQLYETYRHASLSSQRGYIDNVHRCVVLENNGYWRLATCNGAHGFICKYNPPGE